MTKIYKSAFWILAAFACMVLLALEPQAAEYKAGPGDHYDSAGNIVSLDGTVLVNADGTVVETAAESNTGYTVLGNGTGGSSETPTTIIGWTGGGSAGSSTIGTVPETTAAQSTGTTAAKDAGTAASTSQNTAVTQSAVADNNVVSGSGQDAVYSFEGKKYKKSSLYGRQRLTGYSAGETGSDMTYSGKQAQPKHTVAAASDIPIGSIIIVEGASGPYASRYNGVYVVEDRGGEALESGRLIDIYFNSVAEAYAVTDAGWNYADIYIAEAIQ